MYQSEPKVLCGSKGPKGGCSDEPERVKENDLGGVKGLEKCTLIRSKVRNPGKW